MFASIAEAQIGGATFLAAQSGKFPCAQAMRVFRGARYAHMAVLWHVFGDSRACLRKFLARSAKQEVILEIHPTCRRCREHPEIYGPQPEPGDPRIIAQIVDFAIRHSNENTTFLISEDLEDRMTDDEARRVYAQIREFWPFDIVRNPVYCSFDFGADLVELHGEENSCTAFTAEHFGRAIFDADGGDMPWKDYAPYVRRNPGFSLVREWRCNWQGTCGGYEAPERRRFVVSESDVFALRRIFRQLNN